MKTDSTDADWAIRITELGKSFGPKKVLDGVNLSIGRGESMVVIGASGTGKSVLIKHVIGLLKPDSGKVLVDGVDVASLQIYEADVFRRRFGMLFQGGALFDSLNVFDNVAFPLRERKLASESDITSKVEEMLSLVEMASWAKTFPADLSGGMKKRVGLARALVTNPTIMLYDEPTTGLDPVVGGVIDRLIIRTKDRFKVTSITITHDMSSAYRIADKIAMLYKGKVIQVGAPDEIRCSQIPEVFEFVKDRTAMLNKNLSQNNHRSQEE
jgi:phospholipid/cholesterol/gamma-HCH transport system ATP-binding protein